jgi:hypothetical protein
MKPLHFIALSLLSATVVASCGNSASSQVTGTQSGTKAIATSGVVSSSKSGTNANSAITSKGTTDNLAAAKNAGKAVFLVVTGMGATETDKAMMVANGANTIYKNAVILQMNRDDASNAQLVKEYGLSSAPVPLILVISSKGFPTGGYILAQATAENIAALVPSPKLEDVYAAINNGKYAIVAFSKKSFTDKPEVLKECKKAVSMLNNEAVLVDVDLDDSKEANFMNQLRIDKSKLSASLTLVINKQGQVAGTATTIPDAAKLVEAAKKPVAAGCGPGCGPAGCGK